MSDGLFRDVKLVWRLTHDLVDEYGLLAVMVYAPLLIPGTLVLAHFLDDMQDVARELDEWPC